MKVYVALITCIFMSNTLVARDFTIVNRTGSKIQGEGSIPQAVYLKPLEQEKYTVSKGEASWRSGKVESIGVTPQQLTLPPSIFTLEDGATLKISLPDEVVNETDLYGYTVYDFTQAPTYSITTSKVIGSKVITIASPIVGQKTSSRHVIPIYARTRIVPQNGQSYTLSIDGNDVIVAEATTI